jgi:hypothetical protein
MRLRARAQLADGTLVHEFETAVRNWRPGDVLPLGPNKQFRVIDVLDQDPADVDETLVAILVVEPM